MNGIFRIDGPFYKVGNIIYYLLVTNLLWFVFSIPLFTAGASTTALFYVMGKVVRDEDVSVFRDFWKSFRTNFKQSTILWLIIAVLYMILLINTNSILRNPGLFGNMKDFLLPAQIALLVELTIINLYVFPIVSRYTMKTKDVLKSAFFMGNRHFLTTILCIASLVAVGFLLWIVPGLFVLMPVSLYALAAYYLINRVFQKYLPDEKKETLDDDLKFHIKEEDESGEQKELE